MTAQDTPAVSIVMAIRNAERYLAQALDSVVAQTFRDYEVVVVDGESTDGGVAIAQSYPRVRCIAQQGLGFSNAWNQGIAVARAPLIAFLDSDDIWQPDKLAAQVVHLAEQPAVDCVIGRVQFFLDEAGTIPNGFNPALLQGSHVAYMPGTSMLRRSVFDRLGLFESQWQIVSDIVWFARLREAAVPTGMIDDVVLRKRVHADNLSYATKGAIYRSELLRTLHEGLVRQRQRQT